MIHRPLRIEWLEERRLLSTTSTLQVVSLTPTSSGFVVEFNRNFDPSVLNLYDQGGALGAPDVTLSGASTGDVRGSLVVDPLAQKFTFVKTGGPLAPDTYSVNLRSSAMGWVDAGGGLLDGDSNGSAGNDYTAQFTIGDPANAVTLGIADFARGQGQAVNSPASAASGIPITISSAVGVSSASLSLRYDAQLLTITAATVGPGIAGSVALDTSVPGVARLTVSSLTQLSSTAGPQVLVNLSARVPAAALNAAMTVLDISSVHIFDTSSPPVELPSIDDDGVHVVAYFGDANGSQTYNSPDATLAQRVIVGTNTGFSAYKLADPRLIADVSGNGAVQSNDVTLVQRAIVSTSVSQIPLMPPRWFVATTGSDSNTGTDLEHPLATIQRAASLAQPGDLVYVRGGTYRETVTPANSGTAAAPIEYAAYNGETVLINGADPIGGTMPWDLGRGNNQLFAAGQVLTEARWPNNSLAIMDGGSRTPEGVITVLDSDLTQPAGFWNGATFVGTFGPEWVGETGVVIGYTPGTLTIQTDTWGFGGFAPEAGNRYHLTGTINALDAAGEWYRAPDGALSVLGDTTGLEAKRRTYGWDLSDKSYITVTGFQLRGTTIDTNANSTHLTLDRFTVLHPSHFTVMNESWAISRSGVILDGSYNTFRNSEVAYSAGSGVLLLGLHNSVTDNRIHDTAYATTDDGAVTIGTYTSLAYDSLLLRNLIYNSGRSLVQHRNARGAQIMYNDLSRGMMRTNDGAATYTYGQDGAGTRIAYNTIHDIAAPFAAGVYLDNYSTNVIVDHNIVWNVAAGIRINMPGVGHKLYNNTLQGAFEIGYPVNDVEFDFTGTEIKNNIITAGVIAYYGDAPPEKLPVFANNLISMDPKFVDAAHHDFQLLGNSPAIDAGQVVSPYTDGSAGSAPDIGALEFGVPVWSTGPIVFP